MLCDVLSEFPQSLLPLSCIVSISVSAEGDDGLWHGYVGVVMHTQL